MDNLNKKNSTSHKSHITDAATDLLNESKKYANELYEEGMHRVNEAEEHVKKYSDELLKKVQDNPFSAILIAGGIGYLLAKMMKK